MKREKGEFRDMLLVEAILSILTMALIAGLKAMKDQGIQSEIAGTLLAVGIVGGITAIAMTLFIYMTK